MSPPQVVAKLSIFRAQVSLERRAWTEMKRQPHLVVSGSQVIVDLALDRLRENLGGLDLHHDAAVDDHVEPIVADRYRAVSDDGIDLTFHDVPELLELALQCVRINPLEKTVSERVVDGEERFDDPFRGLVIQKWF